MSYYEFTVQIYGSEETAKEMYELLQVTIEDEKIDAIVSVLWEINRKAIR